MSYFLWVVGDVYCLSESRLSVCWHWRCLRPSSLTNHTLVSWVLTPYSSMLSVSTIAWVWHSFLSVLACIMRTTSIRSSMSSYRPIILKIWLHSVHTKWCVAMVNTIQEFLRRYAFLDQPTDTSTPFSADHWMIVVTVLDFLLVRSCCICIRWYRVSLFTWGISWPSICIIRANMPGLECRS